MELYTLTQWVNVGLRQNCIAFEELHTDTHIIPNIAYFSEIDFYSFNRLFFIWELKSETKRSTKAEKMKFFEEFAMNSLNRKATSSHLIHLKPRWHSLIFAYIAFQSALVRKRIDGQTQKFVSTSFANDLSWNISLIYWFFPVVVGVVVWVEYSTLYALEWSIFFFLLEFGISFGWFSAWMQLRSKHSRARRKGKPCPLWQRHYSILRMNFKALFFNAEYLTGRNEAKRVFLEDISSEEKLFAMTATTNTNI